MGWSKLDLQNQDSNRIKKCKRCGSEIVFVRSKKGKFYPVDFNGLIDVLTTDFHKCGETPKSLK